MEFRRIPKVGDDVCATIAGVCRAATITAYEHNVSMTVAWRLAGLLPNTQVFRWVGGVDQWITQAEYDAIAARASAPAAA